MSPDWLVRKLSQLTKTRVCACGTRLTEVKLARLPDIYRENMTSSMTD